MHAHNARNAHAFNPHASKQLFNKSSNANKNNTNTNNNNNINNTRNNNIEISLALQFLARCTWTINVFVDSVLISVKSQSFGTAC